MRGNIGLALGTNRRWGWHLRPLLRPLLRRDVPFAVVGGVALSYYTEGKTQPEDLDVVVSGSSQAALPVYEALSDIVERGVASGPPEFGPAAVRGGVEMTFDTADGTLHIIGRSAGTDSDGIVARRRWVWLDRTRTPLCQLSDLVALKQRDPRDKDLCDLDLLRTLGLARDE